MIRNLKALGLALVAMLAMAAVVASAAPAETADFKSAAGTTRITAEGEAPRNQAFETTAGTVTCNGHFESRTRQKSRRAYS